MNVIGECPARCGLTGGCHACLPAIHPRPNLIPFAPIQFRPMGWECPRCGTIHAPHVDSCACSSARDQALRFGWWTR